jgi:hypothetical protein
MEMYPREGKAYKSAAPRRHGRSRLLFSVAALSLLALAG